MIYEKKQLKFRLKCLKSISNNQHYCQLWWNHPRLLQRELAALVLRIELLERQIECGDTSARGAQQPSKLKIAEFDSPSSLHNL